MCIRDSHGGDEIDGRAAPDVGRGSADEDLDLAALRDPARAARVVERERPEAERDPDRPRLAGPELHPREAPELLPRSRQTRGAIRDVNLDDVRPSGRPGVGDVDLDSDAVHVANDGPQYARRAVCEGGVREPVAEREQDRYLARVVPAVADVHPLAVADHVLLARVVEVRRRAGEAVREGLGKSSGRVDDPEQDVRDRAASPTRRPTST